MNRLPELKSFLKGGEAEEYENVKVTFIRGREAIMTIFEDEKEVEQVQLSKLETKADMHALFVEKGFRKKNTTKTVSTPVDVPQQKKQKALRHAERERSMGLARETMERRGRKQPPNRGGMLQMVTVGVVFSLVGLIVKRKVLKRRNKNSKL